MRKIYCLLLITTIISSVIAQTPLTVDAGKDTNYCLNGGGTGFKVHLNLGGNATATGGVAPYSYNWTMYSKLSGNTFTYLSDSNINKIANPSFTLYDGNDLFVFKVIVTDFKGSIASDSVIKGISSMWMGASIGLTKIAGNDSSQLGVIIDGGVKPFSYKWSPKEGLSNDTIEKPKVYPSKPTFYSVTLVDLLGCNSHDTYPYAISEIKNGDLNTGFVSYKNPVSNSGTMNFTSELIGSKLQIVSLGGMVQYQTKVEGESIPIGSLITTAGIYFYTITTIQGKLVSGSFMRE